MNIWQKTLSLLSKTKQIQQLTANWVSLGFIDISTISQKRAVELVQSDAELKSIVDHIADMSVRIPIRLYRKTYTTENGQHIMSTEEVAEHPILDVLNKPNDYQSEGDLRRAEIAFQLTCGNSYLWGAKVGAKVKMLHCLPAPQVKVKANSIFEAPQGYTLSIGGVEKSLPADEVAYRKTGNLDYSSSDWQYGKSPIMCAPMLMSRIQAVSTSAASTIANGGARGMLVGSNEPGVDYSPEGLAALKANWEQAGAGPKNAGKIVISSANFDYLKIGDTVVDMQLLEMEKANRVALANLYKFPVQLLNSEEASTDNNYATARKQAITDAVLPQVQGYCDSLNRLLVESYGDKTLFLAPDISELEEMQEDYKAKAEWISKVKDCLTPNEVREAFRYGKIDSEEADMTIWERDALSNPTPAPTPNPTRL